MAKTKHSKNYRLWLQGVRVAMINSYMHQNGIEVKNLINKDYHALTPSEVSLLLTCADALRFDFPHFENRASAMYYMLCDYYDDLPF